MPVDLMTIDLGAMFNYLFLSIIGMAMIVGFFRGLKKTLFSFVGTLILYLIFFLTLDFVVSFIWSFDTPYVGQLLSQLSPNFASLTSLEDALPQVLILFVPEDYLFAIGNTHVLAMLTGLSLFVIKIVYLILYFTVFNLIYRIILLFIRIIFFPSNKNKDKYVSKNRGMGALIGVLNASISIFIMLIFYGGLISITESLTSLAPTVDPAEVTLDFPREGIYQASQTIIPLESTLPIPTELTEMVELLDRFVLAYNENYFVSTFSLLTIHNETTDEDLALNLYLFDDVLSFDYEDTEIALRSELSTVSQVAGLVMNSSYIDNGSITDITGEDVSSAFVLISQSKLLTSLIPIAIEVGSTIVETDFSVPVDELYQIDWETEIVQLGEIAAIIFEVVKTAGILEGEMNLDSVEITGDVVRGLFDSFGESELVTLGAYVAAEPLLRYVGGTVEAVITLPEDLVWEDEFSAFGEIIGAVLDTGFSISTLEEADPFVILTALSSLDFTVLLNSKIVTQAFINVLEGALNIEELSMFLVIPDGIIWLDQYDDDGNIIANGELRNILMAINSIAPIVSTLDFEDFQPTDLATLDFDSINDIFESEILVASISEYVKTLDIGFTLILPDSAFDENGYILKTELQNLVSAVGVVASSLMCDEADTACQELGVNISAAFSLSDEDIDALLASDILEATIGDLIITEVGSDLTIPNSALKTIYVETVARDIVSREEVKKVFQAIAVLGITDINNVALDITLLQNLGEDLDPTTLDSTKAEKLFASNIIHATLSFFLIDATTSEPQVVVIPYLSEDLEEIRYTTDEIEYISRTELEAILQALLVLDITDFENLEGLDLSLVTENADIILESSILQATISQQLFEIDPLTVSIPYYDELEEPVRISVGTAPFDTEYIKKTELLAIFDALTILNITDIASFDGNIDLSIITEGDNLDTLLGSAILQATISKQVFELEIDETLNVPYTSADGLTEIRKSVGVDTTSTEYIVKSEISAIFDALNVLDITDITTFDGNVDLSVLSVEGNVDILLSSAIIHATVSQQVFELEDDETLAVPYVAEDDLTAIRVTVGPIGNETEYITKTEINAIFDALDVLNITDLTTFDGNVDLSVIAEGDNATVILSSAIIHATISDQLLKLDLNGTLSVPFVMEDGTTFIRVTVGEIGFETNYIIKSELESIFDGLDVLGITDVNSFDGAVDLSVLSVPGNTAILLSSATIQATISSQIIGLSDDGTLIVPFIASDGITVLRTTVGPIGFETEYIVKSEISAMIDGLNILDITDVESFDGSVDLSVITEGDNATTLLLSSTIQATVSKQIFDLGDDGTLDIPYFREDGLTTIQVTTGPVGFETTYIIHSELESIFDALDILGLTDLETFDGTVDLALLASGNNAETVLSSSIIQATVSTQVLDLDTSNIIEVPYFQDDFTTEIKIQVGNLETLTNYVLKSELVNVIIALDLLGINDVETFDGSVDISVFYDVTNRDTLLLSAIMQATISKQLLDLGSATLTVPYSDNELIDVRLLTGPLGEETEYVSKAEISAIFETLEMLNITDITTFDGNIDISLFYVQSNRDILLASASMHATISKQLFDLGTAILTIPHTDSTDTLTIRELIGPIGYETEFVLKTEIDAMFEALEILNITDINTFDGNIDLSLFYIQSNRDILLASASMHATISKQLFDLGIATLSVPYVDSTGLVAIRLTTGEVGFETEFVLKAEIDAMFEALEILNITDINTFDGNIDLSLFYEQGNRDILLTSASMHATISKQLFDLGSTILTVPHQDSVGLVTIRLTTGEVGFETEFVLKAEIDAMFEALEILNITDITTFDGNIDLSLFYEQGNRDILLASASMHATISYQMLDLGDTVLRIPYTASDDLTIVRLSSGPIGNETEFVVKTEIDAMFEALEILNITDITTFDGNIDLSLFYEQGNRDILLASASMHATISKQMLDLGDATLRIPYTASDNLTIIRFTVGEALKETEYILAAEIDALFEALEILNITDIGLFNGDIDLSLFYTDTNRDILLTSASMHATISKQLFDLGSDTLTVPLLDEDSGIIRLSVGTLLFETEYIVKTEIHAMFEALELLGIDDINSFTGSVNLALIYGDTNQNILLASASMQATISKQINDLGPTILVVPATDVLGNAIKETISGTLFIYKTEIKSLIDGLELLNVTDITTFDGTVSLVNLYNDTNQNILLSSASMHATITKQITDLGPSVLLVPNTDMLGNSIKETVFTTLFIYKDEIKAIINALEVLNIDDISGFTGSISISSLALETDQDTLLTSASMHATISRTLLELDDDVLIIPLYTPVGEIEDERILLTVSTVDFIIKSEIKALINSFLSMGYTDLDNFGTSIDSSKFFDDPDTLLLSYAIQATLSDKLLNGTGGNLIIPNTDFGLTLIIRIVQTDVTYIEINEMKAILAALEELDLTDFNAIAITASNVFLADFDILLASYSMQATISDTILSGALDETAAAGSGSLIVPTYFRETINIGITTGTQIEKVELKSLLTALQTLNVSDFSGTINASVVTSLTDEQLDTVLISGSMHVTIDNMLKGNANINTKIPDSALEDSYSLLDIITKVEIKAFIKATNVLATGDISSVSIDVAVVASLTPAERDIVLDSMIVRNIMTDELETMMTADDPFDLYWPADTSYMNNDNTTFLTEAGINEVLTHYGLI